MLLISQPLLGFIMLLLTAFILIIFFPSISAVGDTTSTIALTSTASEIASAASSMQESSDGSYYEFRINNVKGCQIRIFPGFVELKNSQKTVRAPIASLEGNHYVEGWSASENCLDKPVVKFRKENNRVLVEVSELIYTE